MVRVRGDASVVAPVLDVLPERGSLLVSLTWRLSATLPTAVQAFVVPTLNAKSAFRMGHPSVCWRGLISCFPILGGERRSRGSFAEKVTTIPPFGRNDNGYGTG